MNSSSVGGSSSSSSNAPISQNDPYFAENVRALSLFPKDKAARINAFHYANGYRLERGDVSNWFPKFTGGYYIARTFSHYKGTEFKDTIKVIEKTVEKFIEDLSTIAHQLEQDKTDENQTDLTGRVNHLSIELLKARELLNGIENINFSYGENYKETEDLEMKTALESSLALYSKLSIAYNTFARLIPTTQQTSHLTLPSPVAQESLSEMGPQEKAACSLEEYCKLYNSTILPSKVNEAIKRGGRLVKEILAGQRDTPSEDAEGDAAAIIWFLMGAAIEKRQGFKQGSFLIEDREERIYKFFEKMPRKGERSSSHYIGRSNEYRGWSSYLIKSSSHMGVDVLTGTMPAYKRTLDIAQVESPPSLTPSLISKPMLYIKPENYSPFLTTGYGFDATMHGWEYLRSLATKWRGTGGDDLPGMQKERVPDEAKKTFNDFVKHMQTQRDTYQAILSNSDILKKVDPNGEIFNIDNAAANAKKWGISYMRAFFQLINSADSLPTDFHKHEAAFNSTLKELEKTGQLDHSEVRTGKEVIFEDAELLTYCARVLGIT